MTKKEQKRPCSLPAPLVPCARRLRPDARRCCCAAQGRPRWPEKPAPEAERDNSPALLRKAARQESSAGYEISSRVRFRVSVAKGFRITSSNLERACIPGPERAPLPVRGALLPYRPFAPEAAQATLAPQMPALLPWQPEKLSTPPGV